MFHLGTNHLIFGGREGGGLFFFLKIFFLFSSDRKPEFFFSHSLSAKIFFSGQCSKCILLDLYVRVFLEPNIDGYIVYMFVYTCILDIWVRVYMYILFFFCLISAI